VARERGVWVEVDRMGLAGKMTLWNGDKMEGEET
jgi:hypothetical protein